MKSNLIKDTTKEERIALIKKWIPDDDGLVDCDMDLFDIYADYINGKREIAEIIYLVLHIHFCTENDNGDILNMGQNFLARQSRQHQIQQYQVWLIL